MSKKEKPSVRVHEVVIRGTVEGYEMPSLKDLKSLTDELQKQQGEITTLKEQSRDLQRFLNSLSTRLERMEGFLKSFT